MNRPLASLARAQACIPGAAAADSLGVMSFATDYPDIALGEIKACYAARKATSVATSKQ